MNKIKLQLNTIHFYLLSFVLLNFTIRLISDFGLHHQIIFLLKIILYLTGLVLFFLNCKPLKKAALYFSFYLISPIVIILFWLFHGIFWGLASSLLLFPIYPKELVYEKDNLKVYSKYQGFLGACCTYEILENKFFILEKCYGDIKIEDGYDIRKSEIRIENDSIIYNIETNILEIKADN